MTDRDSQKNKQQQQQQQQRPQQRRQQNPLVLLIMLIVVGVIVQQIVQRISEFFSEGSAQVEFLVRLQEAFFSALPFLEVSAVAFSALLFGLIIYVNKKTAEIRAEEKKELYPQEGAPPLFALPGISETLPDFEANPRWGRVIKQVDSEQEESWRQAIIEADIMLGEMLEHMGYQGESVGERLQQIERSDFSTLEQAWEAHKARNAIAHEGSSFRMTQREAYRIIDLYRQVFEEFHYI